MQSVTFKNLTKHPLMFAAVGWTMILLVKYFPMIGQPATTIGYLWKPEFFLSAFLFISIIWLWKTDKLKRSMLFGKDEFYFIVLPMMLFVVWSGLSILWAISPRNALHHTLLWACYLVFFILIRQVARNSVSEKYAIYGLGIAISIISISCVLEYTYSFFGGSLSSIGFQYSKFAEISIVIIPLLLLKSAKNSPWVVNIFLTANWLLIQCSFGRTQFLVSLACLLACGVFVIWKRELRKEVWLKIGVLCLIALAVQFAGSFGQYQISTLTRLTDKNDKFATESGSLRPVLLGISFEIFKQKPILGVGGDNFIVAFKEGREIYSAARTENPTINVAEDIVSERSHNEYAQILSELGIVGFLIFGWFLFGILRLTFNLRNNFSPKAFAAILGVGAFLTSSLVTSFSFRVPANALVFFFVLAVAVKQLSGREKLELSVPAFQPIFAFAAVSICLVLIIFSGVRGVGLMYQSFAQTAEDEFIAEDHYKKSLYLDEKEAMVNYDYGMFLRKAKRYDEAILHLRSAIDNGVCTSTAYYDLAAAQLLANKSVEAEKTLAEAIKVFPRSVFIRTTFASLLKENGKSSESEENFDIALKINESDAKTWRILNEEGLENITQVRLKTENITLMPDLSPQNGMYAVMDYQNTKNPNVARKR
jgi:O-antigen ligase